MFIIVVCVITYFFNLSRHRTLEYYLDTPINLHSQTKHLFKQPYLQHKTENKMGVIPDILLRSKHHQCNWLLPLRQFSEMASHLPAMTFQIKFITTWGSNHTNAMPVRLISVTWYLGVFGHGAENAYLNPSMIPFWDFVTPGKQPTSGTPSARQKWRRKRENEEGSNTGGAWPLISEEVGHPFATVMNSSCFTIHVVDIFIGQVKSI